MARWALGRHSLLVLLLTSSLFNALAVNATAFPTTLAPRQDPSDAPPDNQSSSGPPPPVSTPSSSAPPPSVSDPPSVSSEPPVVSEPPETQEPQTSDPPPEQSTTPPETPDDTPSTPAPQPSIVISTSGGLIVTETQFLSSAAPSASTTAPTDEDNDDDGDGEGGLGTGPIIGMSVAGGLAVLGIAGFFVWKFTRKRFTDFDDNEAIKWPELNTHSPSDPAADTHALPVHNTGRAGFGDENDMDSRDPSVSGNYSTTDFSHDPYQVSPMPAYNPNVPYRDDPSSASAGMYDPYRGPVPHSIDTSLSGEAIPMSQMRTTSPGPGRAISPNPAAMYGANNYSTPDRTMSPAYGVPDRTMSPGYGR